MNSTTADIYIVNRAEFDEPESLSGRLKGIVCLDLEDSFWLQKGEEGAIRYSHLVSSVVKWVDRVSAAADRQWEPSGSRYRPWRWVACIDRHSFDSAKASLAERNRWKRELNSHGVTLWKFEYKFPQDPEMRHDNIIREIGKNMSALPVSQIAAESRSPDEIQRFREWANGTRNLIPDQIDPRRADKIAGYAQPLYRLSPDDFDHYIGSRIGMEPEGLKVQDSGWNYPWFRTAPSVPVYLHPTDSKDREIELDFALADQVLALTDCQTLDDAILLVFQDMESDSNDISVSGIFHSLVNQASLYNQDNSPEV